MTARYEEEVEAWHLCFHSRALPKTALSVWNPGATAPYGGGRVAHSSSTTAARLRDVTLSFEVWRFPSAPRHVF